MTDDHLLIKENLSLAKQAALGTGFRLRTFVVTIFDRTSHRVGSGTIVRLDNRVFVATAGHVIPNGPVGRLWLINREGRHESEGFPGFIRWGCHTEDDKDVGYLELDPNTAEEYFGHSDFCTIENIANLSVGRERRPIVVTGTPAAKVRIDEVPNKDLMIRFEVMPYWTVPLMVTDWPKIVSDVPTTNPEVDVFLSYPDDECITLESGEQILLPDAPGMSGGGIWDQGFEGGKILWNPDDCKLFAIQGSWHETKRYLRGTQIRHWVDLVYNDYPDLRQLLDSWASRETS